MISMVNQALTLTTFPSLTPTRTNPCAEYPANKCEDGRTGDFPFAVFLPEPRFVPLLPEGPDEVRITKGTLNSLHFVQVPSQPCQLV